MTMREDYRADTNVWGHGPISGDGCDVTMPSCGVAAVGFDREADCLESAIRSAVADVQKAGCVVECVKIEHGSPLLSSGAG